MHLFSYIAAVLATWLICTMICAGVEGIFSKTFGIAAVIATVCWFVGEIIYLSLTSFRKTNRKKSRKDGLHK